MSSLPPRWSAQTQWFRIFKEMIDSGAIAAMGPYAFAVYTVIKSHSNFETGLSFPSAETISEKSGVSLSSVKRSLKKLEEQKYIKREKQGRSNIYTINEKINIKDENGNTAGKVTWAHLPIREKETSEEIKKLLATGEFNAATIIKFEPHKKHRKINSGPSEDIKEIISLAEKINDDEIKNKLISILQHAQEKAAD